MKNIILNTGNLNIEIIPGNEENWWADEPTYNEFKDMGYTILETIVII